MVNTLIYARASTAGQNSSRALPSLREFAGARGWHVSGEYVENASGAKLARPELDKLLSDSKAGDVLLVESIDRLSRLEATQWEVLKRNIQDKGLLLVVMDLPTSWNMLQGEMTPVIAGVLKAVNSMLIDILATMARQDYETRRARQAQGIAKAKEAGVYAGKPKDEEAREMVRDLLEKGVGPARIMKAAGISRATYYRIKKELAVNEKDSRTTR
ncbi:MULTISPECIES: recombinase family protein [Pantoea]|jgi:DNA invertase Pin-like site-specific DNA recombinase|uniref:recombinase family protein n=1 Tax=Pantoea TaxID=53335 RepID=UPI000EA01C0D|nr:MULTISPECIES: recombinase family protein [Pantoea]MBZ6385010.1 recombinase family protein [Pantoea piersonii]MBZ6401287.1 recombinase family protein [Pantoea piersonii]MBZ6409181.1 recombinase family protein [Pantoea piersonii]MBZ6426175.1 recombinase family protein [Pantoea piersonii]NYB00744.1 recombinase family protein [Pantoea piersonii]